MFFFINANLASTAVAPNGLFLYQSKLFGGISAEVTTIFNKSDSMKRLKGLQIRNSIGNLNF